MAISAVQVTSSGGGGGGNTTIISPIGQKAMAASVSVAIASDQSAIPVSISGNQAVNVVQWGGTNVVTAGVNGMVAVGGNIAAGSAPTANPVMVAGFDGVNVRHFLIDTSGRPYVNVAQVGANTVSTAASGTQLVGIADGAGNKLTTNSTTYTAKFAVDVNILGTLGTAFSTAGKVDVKGADGDVFVRQATASNLNAQVVGSVASGGSVSGNPVQVGGLAKTALPTAVSDGQVVEVMFDKFGRLPVLPFGMRDLISPMTQLTLTNTTSETTLISQVASVFLDIISLVCINTSASATQIDFRDSTGGTIRLSLYLPAGDTRGIVFSTPMPQNAVNNNWTAKCSQSVSSVIITGSYISNK